MRGTTPPITSRSAMLEDNGLENGVGQGGHSRQNEASKSSLLMMGFPSRILETTPSLCACHSQPTRGGYLCSRCSSKVCSLPSTCPACGLTLILSTHLARSYRHLFPLRNWGDVSWKRARSETKQSNCFGCGNVFPDIPSKEALIQVTAAQRVERRSTGNKTQGGANPVTAGRRGQAEKERGEAVGSTGSGVSESGRYACDTCGRFFCIDCDVFAHEIVHNCPGCQSREGMLLAMQVKEREAFAESHGHVHGHGHMGGLENGGGDAMEVG